MGHLRFKASKSLIELAGLTELTVLLKVDPLSPGVEEIHKAASVIRSGGTVAFPTETVYGLGCDAFNADACRKIFQIKGRPADNPLIVHISSLRALNELCDTVPKSVELILEKIWPGPITMLLPKSDRVPEAVTAGLPTVAVRMPAHPVALALVDESGTPIAAPSANISGRPSPTKPEHVVNDLWGKVDLVLDGGPTFFGVESTIVKVDGNAATVLRPGPFTTEDLSRIFGSVSVYHSPPGERPLSPGMVYRHYSPSKKLFMVSGDLVSMANSLVDDGMKVAVICTKEKADLLKCPAVVLSSTSNIYEVAKNLFDSLRRLDELECEFGLAQRFEEKGIGLAVMNRLAKACGGISVTNTKEIISLLQDNSGSRF